MSSVSSVSASLPFPSANAERPMNNSVGGLQGITYTELAVYYTTHAVPQVYSPGQVVASIVVAYFGAWVTIFLLARRTSTGGTRNILLLVLAAIVMSTLGVWGMHFVGMHMSLRPVPNVTWHIVLNPGFTAMSLLVTIFGSIVAFLFIDAVRFTLWRVIASGVLLGGVIGLMHFSASFHANFRTSYRPVETVMSILLAMAAATIALTLFFHPRMQMGKRWWRRLLTSAVLAVSVTGMHYLGMSGTSFMVRTQDALQPGSLMTTRPIDLVVALPIPIMAALVIVICLGIHLVDRREEKTQSQAAREVVVCSAAFNAKGQLLVKEQGGLPMVVIKTPLRQKEIRDALDSRQPTFQWLYAVSWQWDLVADWLRGIGLKFLRHQDGKDVKKEASDPDGVSNEGHMPNIFERLGHRSRPTAVPEFDDPVMRDFRDRVIDAARQLAVELDIAFQDIGILFDQPVITGTRKAQHKIHKAAKGKTTAEERELDEEQGTMSRSVSTHSSMSARTVETAAPSTPPVSFWERLTRNYKGATDEDEDREGIVLFLVRRFDGATETVGGLTAEEEHYLHTGYRMMDLRFLTAPFADRYNVTKSDASAMLKALQTYAKRGTVPLVQPGGVYAGLFGVRASTSRLGGLETLVYGFARHQIPAFRLPKVERLTPALRRFVKRLDQISLQEAIEECTAESVRIQEGLAIISLKEEDVDRHGQVGSLAAEAEVLLDREQFALSLQSAFQAMIQSMRVYPSLPLTARVSAELLRLPSTKDDSCEPAELIIVHTVLPEEMSYQVDPSLPLPSYLPQEGTPFVFTPYPIFHKAQVMMMQGKLARDFDHEVRWEMKRRYHTWGTSAVPGEAGLVRTATDDRAQKNWVASLVSPPVYNAEASTPSKTFSGRRSSSTPSTVVEMPPPTVMERVWSTLTLGWSASSRRRAQQMPMIKTPRRPLDLPDVATLAREGSRNEESVSPTSPSFLNKSGADEQEQQRQQATQGPAALTSSKVSRSLSTIPEVARLPVNSIGHPSGDGESAGLMLLPSMMSWSGKRRVTRKSFAGLPSPSPSPSAFTTSGLSPMAASPTRDGKSGGEEEEMELVVASNMGGQSSGSGSGSGSRTGDGDGDGVCTVASLAPCPSPGWSPEVVAPSAASSSAGGGGGSGGGGGMLNYFNGLHPQHETSMPTPTPPPRLSPMASFGTGTGIGGDNDDDDDDDAPPSTASASASVAMSANASAGVLPAPAVYPTQIRNTASLEARVRSDGWTTRYLREIERSPAGPSLLGVDY